MCNICDFDHSLSLPEITKVVRNILYNGIVDYDIPHFKEMMKKRKISIVDVNNVLRAGKHYGPEYVSGEWRHTAYTPRFEIVYHIINNDELTLITAIKL